MANEKRLIDANELKKCTCEWCNTHYTDEPCEPSECIEMLRIDSQPTVDAVPVVHGRNLDADTPSLFECSVCHWSCIDTYYGDTADYNYCPNCGAKMDGGNEDG